MIWFLFFFVPVHASVQPFFFILHDFMFVPCDHISKCTYRSPLEIYIFSHFFWAWFFCLLKVSGIQCTILLGFAYVRILCFDWHFLLKNQWFTIQLWNISFFTWDEPFKNMASGFHLFNGFWILWGCLYRWVFWYESTAFGLNDIFISSFFEFPFYFD